MDELSHMSNIQDSSVEVGLVTFWFIFIQWTNLVREKEEERKKMFKTIQNGRKIQYDGNEHDAVISQQNTPHKNLELMKLS